jgi:hypothetical protein
MTWAKNIPGPQNGRAEAGPFYSSFAEAAYLNVRLHYRGWMCNTYIHKVGYARLLGNSNCLAAGLQINFDELPGFLKAQDAVPRTR